MDRYYVLLSSIDKFGTIPGRDAFHKINYFINLKTDIFIYTWRNWGSFSPEIQQYFDNAYLDHDIAIIEHELGDSSIQFDIKLDNSGLKILENLRQQNGSNKKTIDDAIDFAYDLLNGKTPRQIEILAYVHYIYLYGSSTVEGIWKTINKINPSANFTQDDVQNALNKLHDKNCFENQTGHLRHN